MSASTNFVFDLNTINDFLAYVKKNNSVIATCFESVAADYVLSLSKRTATTSSSTSSSSVAASSTNAFKASVQADSKIKRKQKHPKAEDPTSAFLHYMNANRKALEDLYDPSVIVYVDKKTGKNVSKQVFVAKEAGKKWKNLSDAERLEWKDHKDRLLQEQRKKKASNNTVNNDADADAVDAEEVADDADADVDVDDDERSPKKQRTSHSTTSAVFVAKVGPYASTPKKNDQGENDSAESFESEEKQLPVVVKNKTTKTTKKSVDAAVEATKTVEFVPDSPVIKSLPLKKPIQPKNHSSPTKSPSKSPLVSTSPLRTTASSASTTTKPSYQKELFKEDKLREKAKRVAKESVQDEADSDDDEQANLMIDV